MFFFILLALCAGCADIPKGPSPEPPLPHEAIARLELAKKLKVFEASLGFTPTKHFLRYDENARKYAYCGKVDKFSFDTQWRRVEKEDECDHSSDSRDARFDEVEATNDMNGAPLSSAMVKAPLLRFVMVVLHEDFHAQQVSLPSAGVNESSAQLIGFILARKFFAEAGPEYAEEAKLMEQEATAYLVSARLLVTYHERFTRLYRAVHSGAMPREDALRVRERLFLELELDCAKFSVLPKTANGCSGIKNNIDFDRAIPYARHYELFYDMYLACGKDERATTAFFLRLANQTLSEDEYIARVKAALIVGAPSCT